MIVAAELIFLLIAGALAGHTYWRKQRPTYASDRSDTLL